MKEIGKIMRLMVLSDATDAPPKVGTSYLEQFVALYSSCYQIQGILLNAKTQS
ncbi:hypothetical protein MTYM_01497 [Methylococcales bacterium]|nr:hypothetical protein MTYM_01497 [Methylococcales bacterium]